MATRKRAQTGRHRRQATSRRGPGVKSTAKRKPRTAPFVKPAVVGQVQGNGELKALSSRLLKYGIVDEAQDANLDIGAGEYHYREYHQEWKPLTPIAGFPRLQIVEIVDDHVAKAPLSQSQVPLDVEPRLIGQCKFEWFDVRAPSLRLNVVDETAHASLYESYTYVELPSSRGSQSRVLKVNPDLLRKAISFDTSVSSVFPSKLRLGRHHKPDEREALEIIALFLALDHFAVTTTNVRLPVDNRQSGRYLVPLAFDDDDPPPKLGTRRRFQLAVLAERYRPPGGPYDLAGPDFNRLRAGDTVCLWQRPRLVVIDKIDLPHLSLPKSSLANPVDASPRQSLTPPLSAFEFSTNDFEWQVANVIGRGALSNGVVKVRATGAVAALTGREDHLVVVKLMSAVAYPRSLSDVKRELYYGIWLSTFASSGQHGADSLIRTIGWILIGNYIGIVLEYIWAVGLDYTFDDRMASVDLLRQHYADAAEATKTVEALEHAKQSGSAIDEAELKSARREVEHELRRADVVKSVLGRKHISLYAPLAYLLDVLSAVSFMHSKGIVHKDIKDSNVIIGSNNRATLLDVGSCGLIGYYSAATVTRVSAPDAVFRAETYLFKNGYVDVYSCAILIYIWTAVPAVKLMAPREPIVARLRALAEKYEHAGEDDPSATIDNLIGEYLAIVLTVPTEALASQPALTHLPDFASAANPAEAQPGLSSSVASAVDSLFTSRGGPGAAGGNK